MCGELSGVDYRQHSKNSSSAASLCASPLKAGGLKWRSEEGGRQRRTNNEREDRHLGAKRPFGFLDKRAESGILNVKEKESACSLTRVGMRAIFPTKGNLQAPTKFPA